MIPHVGIDLGTTFSCMSYIDENGLPIVINNSEGQPTTPSVVWFDGKLAYVGKKANDRKLQANSPIYEFVKRDIGRDMAHRYLINGYNYGACGLSAIILKKLKMEAFQFFKKKGLLSQQDSLQSLIIPAVITVPAYFGDKQRHETRLAGLAAGFNIINIINEPTAAALTYGIQLNKPQKILVFDLGGGTFDVTILQVGNGEAKVIASDGADQLGGKDWDAIIESYLYNQYEEQTKQEVPDDMGWDIQKMALEAKFDLTEQPETNVTISAGGETANITLYREREATEESDLNMLLAEDTDDGLFYFEERSLDKLTLCRAILHNTLEKASLGWNDVDEIVLAGGSSRMPMIPKMLEKLSGRSIRRNLPGFNYDTAISQGASLYGRNKQRVTDVTSKSIGIELIQGSRAVNEHLIKKDSPLPVSFSQDYMAEENAVLKVYEGESTNPDECTLRGRLELGNPRGKVKVSLLIDVDGVINASVESESIKAQLKIKSEDGDIDAGELKAKIDAVDIRL
ncbi:Hsp70 family protein [Foetidibacter luteolus]|uniref:Hsp70 family protein n=1 Tax=Foetidibacter luteolus TaxID=2608880 RepID=UPI00129A9AFD|nr:Hsp70 family protein [Foetidibacter luteolus]